MEYGYENHDYYWTLYDNWEFEWTVPWTDHELSKEEIWMVIKSKEYRFIQRLAKHFKLNMTKIDARIALSDFNATDRMLMALAISDNPIELLIDCLE